MTPASINPNNSTLGYVPPAVVYQPYTIVVPVIVHIIHNNTDGVGTGTNICMARIQAQIDELNRDFNNRFSRPIPLAFNDVATSPNFRFVLAQRDPNGNPTNGVTRTGVANNSFCVADIANEPIKRSPANGGVGVEPWNTNQYLNIWVCNLRLNFFGNGNCVAGLIGYANFPDNSGSERHGVVYDVDWFGSGAGINDNTRRRGTTLAHEVGHYFNLRHIWGDDQGSANRCDGVDEINDTPNQEIAVQPENLPQAILQIRMKHLA